MLSSHMFSFRYPWDNRNAHLTILSKAARKMDRRSTQSAYCGSLFGDSSGPIEPATALPTLIRRKGASLQQRTHIMESLEAAKAELLNSQLSLNVKLTNEWDSRRLARSTVSNFDTNSQYHRRTSTKNSGPTRDSRNVRYSHYPQSPSYSQSHMQSHSQCFCSLRKEHDYVSQCSDSSQSVSPNYEHSLRTIPSRHDLKLLGNTYTYHVDRKTSSNMSTSSLQSKLPSQKSSRKSLLLPYGDPPSCNTLVEEWLLESTPRISTGKEKKNPIKTKLRNKPSIIKSQFETTLNANSRRQRSHHQRHHPDRNRDLEFIVDYVSSDTLPRSSRTENTTGSTESNCHQRCPRWPTYTQSEFDNTGNQLRQRQRHHHCHYGNKFPAVDDIEEESDHDGLSEWGLPKLFVASTRYDLEPKLELTSDFYDNRNENENENYHENKILKSGSCYLNVDGLPDSITPQHAQKISSINNYQYDSSSATKSLPVVNSVRANDNPRGRTANICIESRKRRYCSSGTTIVCVPELPAAATSTVSTRSAYSPYPYSYPRLAQLNSCSCSCSSSPIHAKRKVDRRAAKPGAHAIDLCALQKFITLTYVLCLVCPTARHESRKMLTVDYMGAFGSTATSIEEEALGRLKYYQNVVGTIMALCYLVGKPNCARVPHTIDSVTCYLLASKVDLKKDVVTPKKYLPVKRGCTKETDSPPRSIIKSETLTTIPTCTPSISVTASAGASAITPQREEKEKVKALKPTNDQDQDQDQEQGQGQPKQKKCVQIQQLVSPASVADCKPRYLTSPNSPNSVTEYSTFHVPVQEHSQLPHLHAVPGLDPLAAAPQAWPKPASPATTSIAGLISISVGASTSVTSNVTAIATTTTTTTTAVYPDIDHSTSVSCINTNTSTNDNTNTNDNDNINDNGYDNDNYNDSLLTNNHVIISNKLANQQLIQHQHQNQETGPRASSLMVRMKQKLKRQLSRENGIW